MPLPLVSSTELPPGNIITLVTGRNAAGKSSLLREVVDSVVPTMYSNSNVGSQRRGPTRLIAISGVATDRFPPKKIGQRSTVYDHPEYSYFGQRADNNVVSRKRAATSLASACLDADALRISPSVAELFAQLAAAPLLRFRFRTPKVSPFQTFLRAGLRGRGMDDMWRGIVEGTPHRERESSSSAVRASFARHLLDRFKTTEFADLQLLTSKESSDQVFEWVWSLEPKQSQLAARTLQLGLMTGELLIDEILLNTSRRWTSVDHLSSGQWQFLLTLVGLATSVRDESIVLIDEPENGLHPEWQSRYLSEVWTSISPFKNVQVVCATHSALVASSLPTENSFILDLDSGRVSPGSSTTQPADSEPLARMGPASKPVDEILLDTFHLASARNFFFASLVQEALDLFAASRTSSPRYRVLVAELMETSERLSRNDPLRELIAGLNEETLN